MVKVPYADPEKQRERSRELMRRIRAERGNDSVRHPGKQRLWTARTEGKASVSHRFVGVDGEGWTDDNGDHHYMVLVVGDQVLYKERPLTTRECLDFLLGFRDRPGTFKVGFFFDYDVTMILRDIMREDPNTLAEIVNPSGDNYRKLVRWDKYKIAYIPRKRLTIRLYGDNASRVVIHDTRAFFQMSFVRALETYGITGEELPNASGLYEIDEVRAMKAERSEFSTDRASQIIRYCKTECRLLADLMGTVRDRFATAKMDASPYEGPGPVAGKVLKAHGFKDSESLLTRDVAAMARKAYYGGRFEISAHGTIPVPVYEYDITSAYPWAMTQLPCLEHGVWTWEDSRMFANEHDGLWCGFVSWDLRQTAYDYLGQFGPLPFRLPDGRIQFPLAGSGWYWSVEIPPWAQVIGKIMRYHRTCDCRPFEWVAGMFADRKTMERARKGSGIALKLVLNSLYGKLAQRVGARPYFNSVWSGLITALTRERVRYQYDRGRRIVMFATDAVFSLDRIDEFHDSESGLVLSSEPFYQYWVSDGAVAAGLGSWEHAGTYDHLTIFQPGVYFDEQAAKFKTRGVARREIQERSDEFIAAANDPSGEVELAMQNHLGIRQCLAWGPTRYSDLGNWLDAPRTMRVDPTLKRRLIDGAWTIDNGVAWSWPIQGDPRNVSTPYEADPDDEIDVVGNMWEEGLYDDVDGAGWHDESVTTRPSTPVVRPGPNSKGPRTISNGKPGSNNATP